MIDLGSKSERERLSGSALKGFLNLAVTWGLTDEMAQELLGGISDSALAEWKERPDPRLDVDTITRISVLIGIDRALHILYGDKLATEWVALPNSNAIFGGHAPLAYMLGQGLTGMQTVRTLLEGRSAGV